MKSRGEDVYQVVAGLLRHCQLGKVTGHAIACQWNRKCASHEPLPKL